MEVEEAKPAATESQEKPKKKKKKKKKKSEAKAEPSNSFLLGIIRKKSSFLSD